MTIILVSASPLHTAHHVGASKPEDYPPPPRKTCTPALPPRGGGASPSPPPTLASCTFNKIIKCGGHNVPKSYKKKLKIIYLQFNFYFNFVSNLTKKLVKKIIKTHGTKVIHFKLKNTKVRKCENTRMIFEIFFNFFSTNILN